MSLTCITVRLDGPHVDGPHHDEHGTYYGAQVQIEVYRPDDTTRAFGAACAETREEAVCCAIANARTALRLARGARS